MRKCKICSINEATVPDRNKPWSRRLSICSECHMNRLRGDLAYIMAVESKRQASREIDAQDKLSDMKDHGNLSKKEKL